jgi:hypothetical protein
VLVKAFKQYRSPHQNALPRSMPQMAMSSSFCTLLFIYWWKAIRDQINRIQSTFTNSQYHISNLTIQNMQAKNYWKRIRHAPEFISLWTRAFLIALAGIWIHRHLSRPLNCFNFPFPWENCRVFTGTQRERRGTVEDQIHVKYSYSGTRCMSMLTLYPSETHLKYQPTPWH